VDHRLLLEFLRRDLPDASLLPLVEGWLELGKSEEAAGESNRPRGIPLGSPLSPLLANVFLHRLDRETRRKGYELARYADDFVVFGRNREQAAEAYQSVNLFLNRLKLRYEPSKTRIASFDEGFTFLGVYFEGDTYTFLYKGKPVSVHGSEVDWLFSYHAPGYE
jgi:retron-type reverse transcriptase